VEVGRYNKEHDAANLLEMNEESQSGHEPQILSSNFVISDSNKTVLVEDRALREKIAELKQESQVRSEDLVQANKNLRTSDETLERLRGDIENLMNAIHQMSQSSSDRMFNAKTFQDMTQNTEFCPGTNKLLSFLTQLTEQLEIQIQSLSSGTEQIQLDPENKELQIIVGLNSFPAREESIINNALEKTPIHEAEGGYWEQLYKEERKLKEHAERKIESLKNASRKTYHPDLERHIRELQIELTETQDEKAQLQEQVEKYSARAQQWENEYKTVRTRAEKEFAGLQQAIEQREVEMRAYIKDYHDKTKQKNHWNLKGLQDRIKTLEFDQNVTDKLFNDTKTEKARLEDEISRLVDIITAYKEENKKLVDAWGLSGVVPTYTSKPSKVASNTSPSSSESQSNLHEPPYHYANVTEKRLVKLKELVDKQEKCRREDAAIEAMLEKARARKMGNVLYKKKGWSQFLGKKSWTIWDGDGWVNNTDGEKDADGANEEEYDRVQVWREKGVLPPWEEVY
jgi:DNA repair exonuclease SbcCD ATPase subunit